MTRITSCQLINFKNYSNSFFEFHPHVNAFIGNNGMGKTNMLDALHLLSFTKSHFLYQDRLLIKEGEQFFRVVAKIYKGDELNKVVIKYPVKDKKHIEINQGLIEKSSDYVGLFPLVFFAPDDEKIVFGGSLERRKLIDRSIAQFDKNYLRNLMSYNKLLNHRNRLLQTSFPRPDPILLDTIDHQMGPFGDQIKISRDTFINQLIPATQAHYRLIANENEPISLLKKEGFSSGLLYDNLVSSREHDITIKRTSVGIHKDDLKFEIKNKPFKKFGSQGQIKSLLLSIRFAQLDIIKVRSEQEPILIIDDVFDKLDEERIKHLVGIIKSNPNRQVFVSYTNKERLEQFLKNAELTYKIFEIQDGSIS